MQHQKFMLFYSTTHQGECANHGNVVVICRNVQEEEREWLTGLVVRPSHTSISTLLDARPHPVFVNGDIPCVGIHKSHASCNSPDVLFFKKWRGGGWWVVM
jgi:hypothetical protein